MCFNAWQIETIYIPIYAYTMILTAIQPLNAYIITKQVLVCTTRTLDSWYTKTEYTHIRNIFLRINRL